MSIVDRILEEELTPTPRRHSIGRVASLWALAAWVGIALLTAWFAPFRDGFIDQLARHPRFAVEVTLGVAASVAAVFGAIALAIPGVAPVRRLVAPALVLAALWIGAHLVDTANPALPLSMQGKRFACYLETLIYSAPAIATVLWLAKRRYVLEPASTALLAGIAGAAIPSTIMQVACMVDPWHELTHHLLPGLAMLAVGTAAGTLLFRARS